MKKLIFLLSLVSVYAQSECFQKNQFEFSPIPSVICGVQGDWYQVCFEESSALIELSSNYGGVDTLRGEVRIGHRVNEYSSLVGELRSHQKGINLINGCRVTSVWSSNSGKMQIRSWK